MKLFTELPLDQIQEMEKWTGAELNTAKKILADETTTLLHGSECLESIHTTAANLFSAGSSGGTSDLDSLPQVKLSNHGITVVEALVEAELAKSKAEAKRLIKAGGARVNGDKIEDEMALLDSSAWDEEGRIKLSSGKKKHVVLLKA